MKKRVFSLLLACFLIVTSVVIALPQSHVHAADDTSADEWVLPTDWSTGLEVEAKGWDIPVKGNWALTSFTDPADITTASSGEASAEATKEISANLGSGVGPAPYIESFNNRTYTVKGTTAWTSWYVSHAKRWQGVIFAAGGDVIKTGWGKQSNYAEINPTIVFTAPADGIYSYSEAVTGVRFTDDNGDDYSASATVRKNGTVIDTFTPTAENTTKTLTGYVELKKDDLLMFTFSLDTTTATLNGNDIDSSKGTYQTFNVGETVVKLVADAADAAMPLAWLGFVTETDENGWSLAKQGNWFLTHDGNLDGTASTGAVNPSAPNATSPRPWFNGGNNISNGASATSWYVNPGTRWDGVTIFNREVEGEKIRVIPSDKYNPAIVFTAPEDGVYYFGENLEGVDYLPDGASEAHDGMVDKNGTAVEVLATVEVNGEVIDSVVIKNDNRIASFSGIVELKKGDKLAYVFELQTEATVGNHDSFLHLTGAYAAKVSELPGYKGETELPVIFDGKSVTDIYGSVTLMGYDMTKEAGEAALYPVETILTATKTDGSETFWVAIDAKAPIPGTQYKWNSTDSSAAYGLLWAGSMSTGKLTNVGGSQGTTNTGSAIVFTAPYAGTFNISADLGCCWCKSNSLWEDYKIMKADGTEIVAKDNVDADNKTVTNIAATVELEKGEKVIVVKLPQTKNTSNDGTATLTITDMSHTCSADTVKHIPAATAGCENDGNIEYWLCSCGDKFSDADATTLVEGDVADGTATGHETPDTYASDATNHWKLCANDCGTYIVEKTAHTWADGVCSVCTYSCDHTYEDGVCTACGNDCDHADEATTVVDNGDGTHNVVYACGVVKDENVACSGGTATCKTQATCDTCGMKYGETDSANHEGEVAYTSNDNGTHTGHYTCCEADADTADCKYEGITCSVCGYKKDYAFNVSLSTGAIGVKVDWLVNTEKYADATVKVVINGVETVYTDASFVFEVNAKRAGDDIVITLYNGETEVTSVTTSVAAEAKKDDTDYAKALLNYCAAAQTYFGYKTDALVNAGLDYTATDVTADDLAKATTVGSVTGFGYKQYKVAFDATFTLRHEFTLEGDLEGYTVTVNGEKAEVVKNGSSYYVDITGITAADLDKAFELVITKGEETRTVTASVHSYFRTALKKGESYANLAELVKAAYDLGIKA